MADITQTKVALLLARAGALLELAGQRAGVLSAVHWKEHEAEYLVCAGDCLAAAQRLGKPQPLPPPLQPTFPPGTWELDEDG